MTPQEIINSLHQRFVGASLYTFADINEEPIVVSHYGVMQSSLTNEGLKISDDKSEVFIRWDEIEDIYEHINDYDQYQYVVEGDNFYLNLFPA